MSKSGGESLIAKKKRRKSFGEEEEGARVFRGKEGEEEEGRRSEESKVSKTLRGGREDRRCERHDGQRSSKTRFSFLARRADSLSAISLSSFRASLASLCFSLDKSNEFLWLYYSLLELLSAENCSDKAEGEQLGARREEERAI